VVRVEKKYVVGTDVGGTCTDTVVVAPGEPIRLGKVLSTPPDYSEGVLASVQSAAQSIGKTLDELLSETAMFVHGTTVAENLIFTRGGARVGLITTRGFEDTLLVTRGGYGRYAGLTESQLKNSVQSNRPKPLIEFGCIRGVSERVDNKGAVLLDLDIEEAEQAIQSLIETQKVEALAISLLWSFYNPIHERRLIELCRRLYPGLYVTASCDVAPVLGEYERTSTTVMNAYTGPTVGAYLTKLEVALQHRGYSGSVLVMQGYGGLLPAAQAKSFSVGLIEGGPAAGVIGAKERGSLLGDRNIIAADMGGTTFKASIIRDGQFEYGPEPMVGRYHYSVPKMDITSIGAGGGSIIMLDDSTGLPMVGPRSAEANPGPVCYDRGGTEPTLTDVMLLLGYMEPSMFLSGTMPLNAKAAYEAFKRKIAEPMKVSVDEALQGIYRIAVAKTTDLLRKLTVERGIDPRDFALYGFGGACGMICTAFGQELGVKRVVVPFTASVDSANGLVTADIVHEYSHGKTLSVPADPSMINAIYAPLVERARAQLQADGFSGEGTRLEFSIDFHYVRQIHELTTPVRGEVPLDEMSVARVVQDFEALYQQKFGKGSTYKNAKIEMTKFRLTARGLIQKVIPQQAKPHGRDASAAMIARREIFAPARGGKVAANVYSFDKLEAGNSLQGPAVIHTPITTVVVQPGQIATLDGFFNLIIEG
jgi:N-methylhydantoinase A